MKDGRRQEGGPNEKRTENTIEKEYERSNKDMSEIIGVNKREIEIRLWVVWCGGRRAHGEEPFAPAIVNSLPIGDDDGRVGEQVHDRQKDSVEILRLDLGADHWARFLGGLQAAHLRTQQHSFGFSPPASCRAARALSLLAHNVNALSGTLAGQTRCCARSGARSQHEA